MIKKTVTFLLILSIIFTSCSKEKTDLENISGTWKLDYVKINGSVNYINIPDERFYFDNTTKKGIYFLNEINPQEFYFEITSNGTNLYLEFGETSKRNIKILSLNESELILYDESIGIESGDITKTESVFKKL